LKVTFAIEKSRLLCTKNAAHEDTLKKQGNIFVEGAYSADTVKVNS
jgi:hypothetical protein